MEEINKRIKIAPTSSLVLHLTKETYNKGLPSEYLKKIDFDKSKEFADKANQASQYLSSTLLFRKSIVHQLIKKALEDYEELQVCVLGAGLDPIGLQITEQYGTKIKSIYEVDIANMEEKREIYKDLIPNNTSLHTITADLTDGDNLIKLLIAKGYSPDVPSIIVIEGISPYMTEKEWLNMILCFVSKQKHNTVIMDYAISIEELSILCKDPMLKIMSLIESKIGRALQLYSRKEVIGTLEKSHAEILQVYSIPFIEYSKMSLEEIHSKNIDGIEEIVYFKI